MLNGPPASATRPTTLRTRDKLCTCTPYEGRAWKRTVPREHGERTTGRKLADVSYKPKVNRGLKEHPPVFLA
jgi:hypothetical protein